MGLKRPRVELPVVRTTLVEISILNIFLFVGVVLFVVPLI